jgi:predicted deacylase
MALATCTWHDWAPVQGDPASQTSYAVLEGATSGPRVWIQASVHGDEYDAVLALHRLIASLVSQALRGTVTVLPVANAAAFAQASRVIPSDGQDLNRLFPGEPGGTPGQRLADALWTMIRTNADYVIDVHSSTQSLLGIAHAIYFDDQSPVSKISGELARRAGLPVVWQSSGTWLSNALYCRATGEGLPTVLADIGELDERAGDVERAVAGLQNMLRHIGVLDGDSPDPAAYWVVRDPQWLKAEHSGLLMELADVGTRLQRGERVFRITDARGNQVQDGLCPEDDALAITIRRGRPVLSGQEVVSLGSVVQAPR